MPAESVLPSGDLVDRLRSALDRAEEIARLAMVGSIWDGKQNRPVETDGQWKANGCYVEGEHFEIYDEGGHNAEQAEHIAANDPAHVLRTIQAHRKILDAHQTITVYPDGTEGAKFYTGYKLVCASCDQRTETPCPTVRALASIYFPEGTEE